MQIQKLPAAGFEGVWRAEDADQNFLAFIAIHNLKRGPALGGVRFWSYGSEDVAMAEAKRLAAQMTYKAAIADIPTGGGKAIIMKPPGAYDRDIVMRAFAEFINSFQGDYITAKDAGTTSDDMASLHRDCQWVTGLPVNEGGAGDPSPMTALGVVSGIRASMARALNRTSFEGLRVTIQGLGAVGREIARRLCARGAAVWGSDIDAAKVAHNAKSLGLHPLIPETVLTQATELLAPCALGPVITDDNIAQINTRIIAGAANDQLANPDAHAIYLQHAGILYAPDFVINAGGLIHVADEWFGYDSARTRRRCENIETTLAELYERAAQEGETPYHAAIHWGDEILAG